MHGSNKIDNYYSGCVKATSAMIKTDIKGCGQLSIIANVNHGMCFNN